MIEFTESQQVVWEVAAQLWVDTYYEESQINHFANLLDDTQLSLDELHRIVWEEVASAFFDHGLLLLIAVGWMALHTFYFPEELAREKVGNWLRENSERDRFSPAFSLGRFLAWRFMRSDWLLICARVEELRKS